MPGTPTLGFLQNFSPVEKLMCTQLSQIQSYWNQKGFPEQWSGDAAPSPTLQALLGSGLKAERLPPQTHLTCRVPPGKQQPQRADTNQPLTGTHRPRVRKSFGETLTCKE